MIFFLNDEFYYPYAFLLQKVEYLLELIQNNSLN